jgi:hypothetical protein
MRIAVSTVVALAFLIHAQAHAAEVTQLSFDAFQPTNRSCELVELGFLSNPKALRFRGNIESEKRGPLCVVKLSHSMFAARFRSCSIAGVEVNPTSDYVCSVVHIGGGAEFSYGFKYGSIAPPLCSFVCQGK